jgi:two-component system NtrC family response regulator
MSPSSRPRILVVDDEVNMCRTLEILLGEDGRYLVDTASSGSQALERLEKGDIQLLVTDLTMPGMDGLELLKRARQLATAPQVVLMTAYSTVQSAIEAMKAGALEYLIKPFSGEELLAIVDSAFRGGEGAFRSGALADARSPTTGARGEPHRPTPPRGEAPAYGGMIGRSEALKRVLRLIDRAAESDATVLITGESGTGKELVARAIHQHSRRAADPFVAVNCAALTPSLLESELFGHEKGAFTGAFRTKLGRLEQANGGTLFLDEVGEMSPELQTKLLRVLQERTFERVGGLDSVKVNLRFVAATNRDLPQAITEGRFREDLYYRLNVIPIEMPPLRERLEDVPLLVDHFLATLTRGTGPARAIELAPDALEALVHHTFPGNIRELGNLLERALVLCEGDVISALDLPLLRRDRPRPSLDAFVSSLKNGWAELQQVVKELERQLVERSLDVYGERPNEEIARILGTSRRIFELRLQEFGLRKERDKRG